MMYAFIKGGGAYDEWHVPHVSARRDAERDGHIHVLHGHALQRLGQRHDQDPGGVRRRGAGRFSLAHRACELRPHEGDQGVRVEKGLWW